MKNDTIQNDIDIIAKLKFCDEKDRANLILVYLGLKPACSIMLYEAEGHLRAKEILSEIGMYCKKGDFEKMRKWFNDFQDQSKERLILPIGELFVAKDKKTVNELLSISPGKDHQRYGELMGYPQSAIDNFIKNEPQLDFFSLEKISKKHGIIFSFRIPKKDYQNELKVLKKWSTTIKKHAFGLYEELWKQEQDFYKSFKTFFEKDTRKRK